MSAHRLSQLGEVGRAITTPYGVKNINVSAVNGNISLL
jgi:hypothetical protein